MMTMQYIRDYYGVPVKTGGRVRVLGKHKGTIIEASGQYLKIMLDGEHGRYHPTWEVEYLDDDGKVIWPQQEQDDVPQKRQRA